MSRDCGSRNVLWTSRTGSWAVGACREKTGEMAREGDSTARDGSWAVALHPCNDGTSSQKVQPRRGQNGNECPHQSAISQTRSVTWGSQNNDVKEQQFEKAIIPVVENVNRISESTRSVRVASSRRSGVPEIAAQSAALQRVDAPRCDGFAVGNPGPRWSRTSLPGLDVFLAPKCGCGCTSARGPAGSSPLSTKYSTCALYEYGVVVPTKGMNTAPSVRG